MPAGILAEDREEQKYPKWFVYLGIIYAIVLLWTIFSLPTNGYDIWMTLIVLLLWLPVPIGLLYIAERPGIVAKHKKAMRVIFAALALVAIFWGIVLSAAFM